MTNELDDLEEIGNKINSSLVVIRERIGAELGDFTVNPNIKIITGADLQQLAEGRKGEPIIIDNEFCLAYIKDHYYHGNKSDHDRSIKSSTSGCFKDGNKVHFYYCSTIIYMTEKGRGKRYVANSGISNIQTIDLCDVENLKTRLAWCQNCIDNLIKEGGISIWFNFGYKRVIAEYGHAENLMNCVKLLYNDDSNAKQETEKFIKGTIKKE